MPAVLQQLMRHESIETTLRYYVGRDAAAAAEILYEAVGTGKSDTSSDTDHSETEATAKSA